MPGNAKRAVDPEIVTSVQRYLRAVVAEGIAVSFGVVFGSHAAGRTHEWSDIDLLVVAPHFDKGIRREDVFRLWELAARTDNRIEPVPCGERLWREDDSSAIIEIARQEGEIITLS